MQKFRFVIIALIVAIVASTGFTAMVHSADSLLASFASDVTSGPAPLTVHFYDRSEGSPTGWHWNFGDDSSSIRQDPTHTFQTPGTYTVSLTVTSGDESSTTSSQITVTSATPTPTATPQPIRVVPVPVRPISPGDHPAKPIDKRPDTVKKPDLKKPEAPKKPGTGKRGSDRVDADKPVHHFN